MLRTMLGFLVQSAELVRLQCRLRTRLAPFHPEPIHDPHITIAQIPGGESLADLVGLMEDISHIPASYKVRGFEVFLGCETNPYNYIVLRLEPATCCCEVAEEVADQVDIKEIPNNKPHISLFRISKALGLPDLKSLLLEPFEIRPSGVGLWNGNFELVHLMPLT
jgi:hypothetical protein